MPAKDVAIHDNQVPQLIAVSGVSIREDTLYANHKGEEKKGIRKRADKALEKLRDVLAKTLEPDETCLYVLASVQSPIGILEQMFLGWYVYQATKATLVITNRRWIEISIHSNGTWKERLRVVRWGDIAEAKVKGWLSPSVEMKYRDGKKERFWGLKGEDAKKLKVIIQKVLPNSSGELSPAQGIVSLCPDCRAALTPQVYRCRQCGLVFKDEGTATVRAIVIPGGGYFYTGYTFLGVLDAFVEGLLLLVLLMLVLEVLGVTAPVPDEPPAEWGIVIVVLVILALEKLVSIAHARRFVRHFLPAR